MADYAYDQREILNAGRRLLEVNASPLADRKEACANFLEAMRDDPALIAERIGWLIDGNYGYGEMLKAKQIVKATRMNRRAALTHMIAAYEWQCPQMMAAAAWKKLTKSQKDLLDRSVDVVIEAAEKEHG